MLEAYRYAMYGSLGGMEWFECGDVGHRQADYPQKLIEEQIEVTAESIKVPTGVSAPVRDEQTIRVGLVNRALIKRRVQGTLQ